MIVSQNGTIVGSAAGGTPAAYTVGLMPSSTPVVVEHPLSTQPSAVSFVNTAGVPHELDWTCDTTFPYAVHLAAVLEPGTLTVR